MSAERGSEEEGESGRLPKSLIYYRMKRRGPRMEPWGTSEITSELEERVPAIETCW